VSAPQTEYPFTLPIGFVDDDGVHHREGSMRLATARDEIEPLRDSRVRENGAYLSVLKLARVLTNVGPIQPVTPAHVEQLYAADFAHLERLYAQINAASVAASPSPASLPSASTSPPSASPPPASMPSVPSQSAPRRAPALVDVSEAALDWMLNGTQTAELDPPPALPIGVAQDRERSVAREALTRSETPPRRGRIYEGVAPHTHPVPGHESPSEQLMRLSSQPPPTPVDSAGLTARNDLTADGTHGPAGGGVDIEDVYEEMIVRLRRELLVERERMGAPFGA
jgi:hypothetical protein